MCHPRSELPTRHRRLPPSPRLRVEGSGPPTSRAASTGPIPRFDASEAVFLAIYPDPVAVGDLCLAGERTAPGTTHGIRQRPDGRGQCVLANTGVFGMAPGGRTGPHRRPSRPAAFVYHRRVVRLADQSQRRLSGPQSLPHGGEPGLEFPIAAPLSNRGPDPGDLV